MKELPLYGHHVQSTNYQASNRGEQFSLNVNIPKQEPGQMMQLQHFHNNTAVKSLLEKELTTSAI